MADFVAVLKKTIDGLKDNTPEMRAKVYARARATIDAKLASIQPSPPASVAERQRQAIETAIVAVEAQYAPPVPESSTPDDLDALLHSFNSATTGVPPTAPVEAESAPAPVVPIIDEPTVTVADEPVAYQPVVEDEPDAPSHGDEAPLVEADSQISQEQVPAHDDMPEAEPKQEIGADEASEPSLAEPEQVEPEALPSTAPQSDAADEIKSDPEDALATNRFTGFDTPGAPQTAYIEDEEEGRSRGKLIASALALLVLAGGAYAGYRVFSSDQSAPQITHNGSGTDASLEEEGTDLPEEDALDEPGRDLAADQGAAQDVETGDAPAAEQAAAADAGAENKPAIAPAEDLPLAAQQTEPQQKFTQRLREDGSEIDMGPQNAAATGEEEREGRTVASATQPGRSDEPTQLAQNEQPAVPETPAGAVAPAETVTAPQPEAPRRTQPLVVGQRSIFYEERTNAAGGSREDGNVVWSVVQESPGNDLPPEPAIRAEASIPSTDLHLRLTIRRNADPTLPAGQIMELIFLTPEKFGGGGIQNIVRVALKDTEESTGNPLMGIPARIADGFFLMALSDSPAEIQANLSLLRARKWIDVPMIYQNGRRALITLEKGIPGDRVFDEVIKSWQSAS